MHLSLLHQEISRLCVDRPQLAIGRSMKVKQNRNQRNRRLTPQLCIIQGVLMFRTIFDLYAEATLAIEVVSTEIAMVSLVICEPYK